MNKDLKKQLSADPDGLLTYEYIANHIGSCDPDMDELIDNMIAVDSTGQFLSSAARYLNAINPIHYHHHIDRLIATAIDRDRERRYIAQLLQGIWGDDYEAKAPILMATSNNFRRIYKRVNPNPASL